MDAVYRPVGYMGCIFASAILIIGVFWHGGVIPVQKSKIPARIPQWWLALTGVLYSVLLWYVTGGMGGLVAVYLTSKAVLSINYMMVLDSHDNKYSELIGIQLSSFSNYVNSFNNKGSKYKECKKFTKEWEKDYWDVNIDDDKK